MQIDAHGIGNGNAVLVLMDSDDWVSRANFSFAKDAQIKTAASAEQETLGQIVAIKLQIQLEAWNSRLGNYYLCRADREMISDENIALQQAGCREVFTESAPG